MLYINSSMCHFYIFIHRRIDRAVRTELRRKSVSQLKNTNIFLRLKQNDLVCGALSNSFLKTGGKMSPVKQEHTSLLTVQTMVKTIWVPPRETRGGEATPASTTRPWTRPGGPPTPPPSSRCVTAKSNGKVARPSAKDLSDFNAHDSDDSSLFYPPQAGTASSTMGRVFRCLRGASPSTSVAPTPRCGCRGLTRREGRASSPAVCAATGRRNAAPSDPTPSRSRSVAATTSSTSSRLRRLVTWLTVQVLNRDSPKSTFIYLWTVFFYVN